MDLLDRERPGQRGGASQVLPRVPNSKPRVKITPQGLPVLCTQSSILSTGPEAEATPVLEVIPAEK